MTSRIHFAHQKQHQRKKRVCLEKIVIQLFTVLQTIILCCPQNEPPNKNIKYVLDAEGCVLGLVRKGKKDLFSLSELNTFIFSNWCKSFGILFLSFSQARDTDKTGEQQYMLTRALLTADERILTLRSPKTNSLYMK